jgi:hypothetical protein
MKFIKPNEISGKIITLLEESDKYAILITPYVKISQWNKLKMKLDNLLARKVQLRFYIRDDPQYNKASFEELDSLNYPYTTVPNLHCKIYLNEKYGIITSMNLLLSSEEKSLEIGYVTDTPEEHQELIEYCKRYFTIRIGEKKDKVMQFTDDSWKDYIIKNLDKNLGGSARYNSDDADYRITTFRNNYDFFIYNEKKSNNFRIKGILSTLEYEAANNSTENLERRTGMKIALYEGSERHYASVWGTLQTNLKSSDIKYLEEDEKKLIADSIIKFITAIDKFKDSLYNIRL